MPGMFTGNFIRRAGPQSVRSVCGARSSLVSGGCAGGLVDDSVDDRSHAVRAKDTRAESAVPSVLVMISARVEAAAIKYPVA